MCFGTWQQLIIGNTLCHEVFPFIIKKSFELWIANFSTAKDCEQLVCKVQDDTTAPTDKIILAY